MKTELDRAFDLIAKQTVSVREAANVMGCSQSTVHELMGKRNIKAYKIGAQWRIVSKGLDDYMRSLIQKVE